MQNAINALKEGKPILLFDSMGRENETDIVIHAKHALPEIIELMRKDAGGLICLAVGQEISSELGIPYLTDIIENTPLKDLSPAKTAYGDKPAFSWPINHRKTYTGITDEDRSRTITKFCQMVEQKDYEIFTKDFYAPGHVPLLCAKSIGVRRGHTELSIELARLAEISQTMVLCEMMSDNHRAQSFEQAKRYAEKNGLELVDGGLI